MRYSIHPTLNPPITNPLSSLHTVQSDIEAIKIDIWDPLNNETGSRSPCMRPRSDRPKMKNCNVVRSRLIILINEEINEANWIVSNSAKLDRRTKQHTQSGVSASNGSRDMAATKSWLKKRKKKNKNNKANCMISNSAKLDSRTKQHTQSGVSTSDGSRDIAATKSWLKKRKKKNKNNKANCMISNSAKLDSRTKQHTQSGVSTSDGSRDIAATKSWRKKKEKE